MGRVKNRIGVNRACWANRKFFELLILSKVIFKKSISRSAFIYAFFVYNKYIDKISRDVKQILLKFITNL